VEPALRFPFSIGQSTPAQDLVPAFASPCVAGRHYKTCVQRFSSRNRNRPSGI